MFQGISCGLGAARAGRLSAGIAVLLDGPAESPTDHIEARRTHMGGCLPRGCVPRLESLRQGVRKPLDVAPSVLRALSYSVPPLTGLTEWRWPTCSSTCRTYGTRLRRVCACAVHVPRTPAICTTTVTTSRGRSLLSRSKATDKSESSLAMMAPAGLSVSRPLPPRLSATDLDLDHSTPPTRPPPSAHHLARSPATPTPLHPPHPSRPAGACYRGFWMTRLRNRLLGVWARPPR